MNKFFITLIVLISSSTFAGENYAAKELQLGTVVKISNDIDFGDRTTGVFIQNGKVHNKVEHNTLVGLEAEKSKCFLTVDYQDYDPSTGTTLPLNKGEIFQVHKVEQDIFTSGSVHIDLRSRSGRNLYLDCDKSIPHLTIIKINEVKKSLESLIEIED